MLCGCLTYAMRMQVVLSTIDTTVYLVQGGWFTSWGSPYLDAHGEEDVGRKTQTLNPKP